MKGETHILLLFVLGSVSVFGTVFNLPVINLVIRNRIVSVLKYYSYLCIFWSFYNGFQTGGSNNVNDYFISSSTGIQYMGKHGQILLNHRN